VQTTLFPIEPQPPATVADLERLVTIDKNVVCFRRAANRQISFQRLNPCLAQKHNPILEPLTLLDPHLPDFQVQVA
jgi:hypothetical protein